MKLHKQIVLIEIPDSYLEVISFYDTGSKSFGADIYYECKLAETINSMINEPMHEHLLSLGYHFLKTHDLNKEN